MEAYAGLHDDPGPVEYDRMVYRLRTLTVDGERLHYAAPDDWTDADAVKHLLGIC